VRLGTSYFGPPPLPYVPGAQGVGVIEEGGRWPAGQRSGSAATRHAARRRRHGQWCVAAEESIRPLPDGVSDDLAAALGLSAIAAWTALSWRPGCSPASTCSSSVPAGRSAGRRAGRAAARAARVVAACRDAHGRAGLPNSAPTRSPT